jgi:peptide/nickel transport system substrate-binding protein
MTRHSQTVRSAAVRARRCWQASRSALYGMLVVLSVSAVALAAAGCGSNSSSPSASSGAPVSGGTAVFAEPPATTPSYIFPYISSSFSSDVNTFDFEYLMYRPLYWIGTGADPTQLNTSVSLANPPAFSGKNVTITLKDYKWSNGTPVTAQDVLFWLNMETAVPADYASYTTFPADVSDIKVVSPTELTMTMDKAYNPAWFTLNQLSQITPMPEAWDRTASGPSKCSTDVKDCAAVYNYLNAQAKNTTSYVGSPLWGIVDGPWKLSAFNADGHVAFVPNKSYSGPVRPRLAGFAEVPFTTDAAEYNVLQSPNGGTKIDFGYLPQQDAQAKPANQAVGANPLASKGYTLYPWPVWGINYSPVNYQSSVGDHAAVIKQLYFRQALAYLMNQGAVLSGPLRGYGNITVGPVGSDPVTPYLSAQGKAGDPFPYNPAKAKSLLAGNGWKVVPGGTTTCVKPGTATGDCGKGITAGTALSFNFPYATGTQWIAQELQQLQSNAATIGIRFNLQPKPFNQVIALAAGNCVVAKISCDWDIADWGGGWSFSPDYLPTGEQLFSSGAAANSGGYSDAADDSLINKTLTSSSVQAMFNWQDYLSKQEPFVFQPNADYQLNEIANNLKGVTPMSPTLSINPENWYFVK